MSQLLAIDWDGTEVRFVLAAATGSRLKVRSMGAAPIPESIDDESSQTVIGHAIRSALSGKRPGRCPVLVALGRSSVDFVSMTLPPAKDVELPELVANEVLRQSPHLTDDATVDFVAFNKDATEPRVVSAAVCPADQIDQVKRYCDDAGVSANCLVMRPFALTSLLSYAEGSSPQTCLLVCRVGEESDLAVVSDGRVIYTRTVTLPKEADDESARKRLLGEISRTLLVAPQGPILRTPVERVYLFGVGDDLRTLAEQVTADLELPASIIDPFAEVGVSQAKIPSQPDRFVPLIGVLQDEARKTHALDFLHPRKPPAPPNRRRQMSIAGAVVAVIALVLGFQVWESLRDLENQNDELMTQLKELEASVKAANQRIIAESIREWQASNVNWLDELRDFTLRFPSGRDAVVLRMTLTPARNGGGEIILNGLVRDPAIVLRMENSVRDEYHGISSKGVQERVQEKAYSWIFDSRVAVKPRSKEEYQVHFLGEEATPESQLTDDEPVETVPVAAVSSSANPAQGSSDAEAVNYE